MAYLEHDGARLYFEVAGKGPALVFSHGAALDSRQWAEQVAAFKDRYTVITWDARGHGRSSLPDGPVDPASLSSDLVALLDHLGVRTAALCGLSMGGHLSLQAAIRYPDRVAALALIGSPCSNSFNRFERFCVPINRRWMARMPLAWSAGLMAGSMLAKPDEAKRRYLYESMVSMTRDRFSRVWDAVTRMESRDGLASIRCPTLLLIGDKDSLTGHQQSFMRDSIAGARLVVIPEAGHATNLDNPGAVDAELDAFLGGLSLA